VVRRIPDPLGTAAILKKALLQKSSKLYLKPTTHVSAASYAIKVSSYWRFYRKLVNRF
jgi:hypothetical protein